MHGMPWASGLPVVAALPVLYLPVWQQEASREYFCCYCRGVLLPGANRLYPAMETLLPAVPWTTVSGIATSSYTLSGLTAGTAYQFQVSAVCASSTSAYSSAYAFTTGTGTIAYCASSGGTAYEYINKVVLGSISNTSGNNGGYADFTSQSTTLAAGSSYTASLTPGFAGASYTEAWTLWIDYNGDGDFVDAGEKVGTKSSKTTSTITFTVPATAKSGNTRIRIQMKFSTASANSCLTYNYGEVEDYTANITGGNGFAPASLIAETTTEYNRLRISPNPVAHATATLSYHLATGGNTTLKVVDMAGRTAQVISQGNLAAGPHTYQLITTGKLHSGNYIVVLEQAGKVIARSKLVVSE